MFSFRGDNGPESSTKLCLEEFARGRYELDARQLQCLAEFIRMRHQERSLLSKLVLFLPMPVMAEA